MPRRERPTAGLSSRRLPGGIKLNRVPQGEYLWRLPQWANDKFERLLRELHPLDEHDDEAYAIREEIRCLPGFPKNSESYTLIHRVVTTTSH